MKLAVMNILRKAIEEENLPGALISISKGGQPLLRESIGNRTVFPVKEPMDMNTVFDLASLTKVVATLPAVLLLMDQRQIHLSDKVAQFIPEFAQGEKESVTIQHLLTHTSGLPAFKPFYKEKLNKEEVIYSICHSTLESPVGKRVIYSDLGFIMLSAIVEQATGQSFEHFVENEIFTLLGMNETGFNPGFTLNRYAATEYDASTKTYKRGIVHDENAETIGGISGHAGLFSTCADLEKFASMIENNGFFNNKPFISSEIIELSRKNFTQNDRLSRGLGWELNVHLDRSCGASFSKKSYGHTGFTGTSIWFDPEQKLRVLLLTNYVHYGRHPLRINSLRKAVHQAVITGS